MKRFNGLCNDLVGCCAMPFPAQVLQDHQRMPQDRAPDNRRIGADVETDRRFRFDGQGVDFVGDLLFGQTHQRSPDQRAERQRVPGVRDRPWQPRSGPGLPAAGRNPCPPAWRWGCRVLQGRARRSRGSYPWERAARYRPVGRVPRPTRFLVDNGKGADQSLDNVRRRQWLPARVLDGQTLAVSRYFRPSPGSISKAATAASSPASRVADSGVKPGCPSDDFSRPSKWLLT